MHLQVSLYHRVLRVVMVLVATVLLFDSGVLFPITKQLSDQASLHVASVIGVGAAVEPTELNMLTAELTRQRTELEEREAALVAREIEVAVSGGTVSAERDVSTYILSALLFIILVLVILNYVLDFMREQHLRKLATDQVIT